MKRTEQIIREMLYQCIEKKNHTFTQSALSKSLKISLSIVNSTIKTLERIGALEARQRGFTVIDIKKVLFYWASIRSLQKDILITVRIEKPVREMEKTMPNNTVFAAYSAYKFLFDDVPADYSEVYVYGDKSLQDKFPKAKGI